MARFIPSSDDHGFLRRGGPRRLGSDLPRRLFGRPGRFWLITGVSHAAEGSSTSATQMAKRADACAWLQACERVGSMQRGKTTRLFALRGHTASSAVGSRCYAGPHSFQSAALGREVFFIPD
ncbi:hypothetical protein MRX96_039022 [Rhipicephalus microplus]